MQVNLIVIYVSDTVSSREFYESVLNFKFNEEQHGSGPVHYSTLITGLVFEIYPKENRRISNIRLGFEISNVERCVEKLKHLEHPYQKKGNALIFKDVDGNILEITENNGVTSTLNGLEK